jgi:FAD binding domain
VIVGARCAGATLAIELARRDWDVLVVDRDTFPSDTVSTHFFYPNTLSRFAELGILDTLRSSHRLPSLAWRVIGMGHEIAGKFTPVDGFDRASSARRITLDKGILDTALAAGAEGRFGEKVVDLIGSGTDDDPVSGVVLESGERISAKWFFGADGRGSTVAGRLGIEKERPQRGELSYLFGYWRGLPDAPESLMRGFFRTPTGPGWAQLGHACHFKHPGTAQGIADAVEQAIYIAEHLSSSNPSAGRLSGMDRSAGGGALRLVFCLGPVPEAGSLGQALRGVGERAGRGAGRARHLQPSGRPVPRSERGTPRALVLG